MTRSSGCLRFEVKVINEEVARNAANEWIAGSQFSIAMTTRRHVETNRTWVFEVVAVSGEPVFGNAPLVVDKSTGVVRPCREAWREFVGNLGVIDHFLRWWHWRFTY